MVWWMDEQIDKYIGGQIVGQREIIREIDRLY